MKNNIKVLHVIASLGNGGAERQLVELLKHNRNHGVVLFTDADVYKDSLNSMGIKYWEFNVKGKLLVFNKIFMFKRILQEFKPDIIQAWMYNACLFSAVCKFCSIYKLPLIWCIRCSDMITKYYSTSLKLVILSCRIFSKTADKIIYNSVAGMSYHKKIGFIGHQQEVIFNGVDSSKFKFDIYYRKKLRNYFSFKSTDIVLLCVARIDPMKNHINFLKAYKDFQSKNKNKIKLLLIGKDTDNLSLPANCYAIGMTNNIEQYYSLADIIILPSSFGEGFSNVLVEGMLSNLLPVATDVGDAKKIICNTGYLIEEVSSLGIGSKLEEIGCLKMQLIKSYGLKARKRAESMFSIRKMVRSYNSIYKKVLN
ncbi:MAG: hypothetical protein CMP36_01750 [Rickettsiales bacterium]|nr:hypothetical protein [Rickettsiales bacterium]OUV81515.1 MAG: hypothetical protein CBC91_02250 [Rickettsiales bacterium TMED131]